VVVVLSLLACGMRSTTVATILTTILVTILAIVAATRTVPRPTSFAVFIAILALGASLLPTLAALMLACVAAYHHVFFMRKLLNTCVALKFVFSGPVRDKAVTWGGKKALGSEVLFDQERRAAQFEQVVHRCVVEVLQMLLRKVTLDVLLGRPGLLFLLIQHLCDDLVMMFLLVLRTHKMCV